MILLLLLTTVLLVSCSNEHINQSVLNKSNKEIIINDQLYKTAADDQFNFSSVIIEGDSLKITIEYGGGCGDVIINLIDSGSIMESWPVQRNIRISLDDKDYCEALISKNLIFDLTPLKVSEADKVVLNLSGWGDSLVYKYW